jgi:hypothetical protein
MNSIAGYTNAVKFPHAVLSDCGIVKGLQKEPTPEDIEQIPLMRNITTPDFLHTGQTVSLKLN